MTDRTITLVDKVATHSTVDPADIGGVPGTIGSWGRQNEDQMIIRTTGSAGQSLFYEFPFKDTGAIDLTGKHFVFSSGWFLTADSSGLTVSLVDANDNIRRWNDYAKPPANGAGSEPGQNYFIVLDPTLGPFTDTGPFDLTQVDRLRYDVTITSNHTNSFSARWYGVPRTYNAAEGIKFGGGDVSNPLTISDLDSLLRTVFGFISETTQNDPTEIQSLGNYTRIIYSVGISAPYINFADSAIVFSPDYDAVGVKLRKLIGPPTFFVDGPATQVFERFTIVGADNEGFAFVDNGLQNRTYRGVNLSTYTTAQLGDSTYTECSFSGGTGAVTGGRQVSARFSATTGTTQYIWDNGADISGSTFVDDGTDYAITFNGDNFADGDTVDLTLVNFEGTPGTTLFRVENATGKTLNVLATDAISLSDFTIESGTVAIQIPTVDFTAPNFADGTRYHLSRRQIFTIAAADIDTVNNQLTLGTDQQTETPDFRTTNPSTLVRLSLSPGATIPTTTPQIIDGGVYRVRSEAAGVITLSVEDEGTVIDFSDQGVDANGFLFTVVAETELVNAVVSGGSGVVESLALPDESLVRWKARHWYSSGGRAKASEFFEGVVQWNVLVGASVFDTVDADNVATESVIHNRITEIAAAGATITLADGTQILGVADGSTLPGLSVLLEGVGRVQINISDADGTLLIQDLYAWGVYVSSTPAIRLISQRTFQASDLFNFTVEGLEFENTHGSVPLRVVGGLITDTRGLTPIANSSFPLFPNVASTGNGAAISTGVSGLTAAESAQLTAIPTNPVLTSDARLANLDAPISNIPTADHTGQLNDILTAVEDKTGYALTSVERTAIAAATRLNLATELGLITANLNAPVGDIPTADHSAILSDILDAALDKTGYSLSTTERNSIAVVVEAALLNEGDGQPLIDAIVNLINSNLDIPLAEVAIIAQGVRTELATELAFIDQPISSRLPTAGYTAPTANLTKQNEILAAIAALIAAPTTGEIRNELAPELSRVITNLNAPVGDIPTTPLLAANYEAPTANLTKQNEILAAIAAIVAAPTTAQIRTELAPELTRVINNLNAPVGDIPTNPVLADTYEAPTATVENQNQILQAILDMLRGGFVYDFNRSVGTQYAADSGETIVKEFDLIQQNGAPATSFSNLYGRVPRS